MKIRRHHFSLVEILVVISILAILVTMLFPAVNGIKESAKRMNCFNRVKTLATENLRFSETHQGRVALDSMTLYDYQEKLYSANQLSWYMWLNADGFGGKLSAAVNGVPPVDPNSGVSQYTYKLPGEKVEYTNNGQDGLYSYGNVPMPPGANYVYYYDTVSYSAWNFICDNCTPSVSLCRNFTSHFDMLVRKDELEGKTPVYPFTAWSGNFAVNTNFYYTNWANNHVWQQTSCIVTGDGRTASEMSSLDRRCVLTQANVKSPSVRAYLAETSMQDSNNSGCLNLQFPTSYVNFTDLAFVPGYGCPGTRGADIYEAYGDHFDYANYTPKQDASKVMTQEELDVFREEAIEKNRTEITEGRHNGYTLHGFYDGHAEMLTAQQVGNLQTQRNTGAGNINWVKYMTGPYGDPTISGEYKEGANAIK